MKLKIDNNLNKIEFKEWFEPHYSVLDPGKQAIFDEIIDFINEN